MHDLVAVALSDDRAVIARLAVQVNLIHGHPRNIAVILIAMGEENLVQMLTLPKRQTTHLKKVTPGRDGFS
jgi:hypothetical protein